MTHHKPARRRLPEPVAPDPELVALGLAGAQLHETLTRYVRANRLAGVSWSSIGRLLGVSRQAARKRWMHLDREPVVIRWTRTPNGRRESSVTCERTGAVFGDLERTMVEAFGYVPVQSLRVLGPPGMADWELEDVLARNLQRAECAALVERRALTS